MIQVGNNASDSSFFTKKRALLHSIGLNCLKWNISSYAQKHQIEELIVRMNSNPDIHGITLHLPLPDHLRSDQIDLINLIDSSKDVDNLTTENRTQMLEGYQTNPSTLLETDFVSKKSKNRLYFPGTSLATLRIFQEHKIDCRDKQVVILGNSYQVGYPLSVLMTQLGAEVSVYDHHSNIQDKEEAVQEVRPDLFKTLCHIFLLYYSLLNSLYTLKIRKCSIKNCFYRLISWFPQQGSLTWSMLGY